MSLSLRNLFEETKHTYHLELVCGESGLDNLLHWVYITEDFSTASFLQGGELILTTGMSRPASDSWLYDFLSVMIKEHTCGTILNLGPYLTFEDITPEIRQLCEDAHYPLLTMPWEIRFFDITHDYYDRIFHDTQNDSAITAALLDLLSGNKSCQTLSSLAQFGFPALQSYRILCLSTDTSSLPEEDLSRIFFWLKRYMKRLHPSYVFQKEELFVFLLPESDFLFAQIETLFSSLENSFSQICFHLGVGSISSTINELSESFFHSKSALLWGISSKKAIFAYDDMGFYKLLLSIRDRKVLTQYITEKLGTLITYDKQHHSSYLETLRQYLFCDGSIQKIAAALFCHRNTVLYRIRILKEEFSFPLDDIAVRFELMAAFQIMEYLNVIEKQE